MKNRGRGMLKGIPDRWLHYKPISERMPGTPFVAFKVPLKEELCKGLSESKKFTPSILVQKVPDLSVVIDLTYTTRYYDAREEFVEKGIRYEKIYCPGQMIPPENLYRQFEGIVDDALRNGRNQVIGVHCTHGLNRTGYFICRYMVERLNYAPDQAIQTFEVARGHQMERFHYMEAIRNCSRGQPDTSKDQWNRNLDRLLSISGCSLGNLENSSSNPGILAHTPNIDRRFNDGRNEGDDRSRRWTDDRNSDTNRELSWRRKEENPAVEINLENDRSQRWSEDRNPDGNRELSWRRKEENLVREVNHEDPRIQSWRNYVKKTQHLTINQTSSLVKPISPWVTPPPLLNTSQVGYPSIPSLLECQTSQPHDWPKANKRGSRYKDYLNDGSQCNKDLGKRDRSLRKSRRNSTNSNGGRKEKKKENRSRRNSTNSRGGRNERSSRRNSTSSKEGREEKSSKRSSTRSRERREEKTSKNKSSSGENPSITNPNTSRTYSESEHNPDTSRTYSENSICQEFVETPRVRYFAADEKVVENITFEEDIAAKKIATNTTLKPDILLKPEIGSTYQRLIYPPVLSPSKIVETDSWFVETTKTVESVTLD